MESPLVVGVDGSDPSHEATDWAADEALRHGLPLRLVYASLWQRYEGATLATDLGRPDGHVYAENIVGSAAERVRRRAPDLRVVTDVLPEDTVDALLGESRHAFALVTGSRGRGDIAGLLLGSVSLAVAARAHCPVIVVRGDGAGLAGTHERITLGVGDADTDSAAVRFAFREAELRDCTLDVVRAWRRPAHGTTRHPLPAGDPARHYEDEASNRLDRALEAAVRDHPDVRVRRATVEGPARKVLLARSAAADLLIVGARRRHGQFGMQLGRAAHTVLHHASCPVAVVPQTS
ncbi:universal stress protein [Streptomyces sp. WAC05374]|uniref:universal stress protein n=1 Tax=Streptomyces sp. WAC05374 TaxID=2487420 RepID=UPI000F8914FC|nr:universal stress protein [Streptomyces sp. WAC05374]RST17658.1 universal stress protein [Streptomyces sp. WAC05374]TDF54767.1 universal stress protein [Streptomyces sp. WAC05374]TDF56403.1 universal stress protein [Streptomyces sp. WAC05374]